MKKLTLAASLVGGALLASQSAFGGFIANDLYLGFQNAAGGGSSDYVINLGAASALPTAYASLDLSSDFSLANFNSVLGASSSLIGGVVGGSAANSADIFVTQLRTGNLGEIGTGQINHPGSSVTATPTRSQIQGAVSTLGQLTTAPAPGTGALDTTKQWEAYVDPALPTSSTFNGNIPFSPDATIAGNSVNYLDLWTAAKSTLSGTTSYSYLGYFAIDTTGASPSLIFTPAAVPEPGTCSLIGGGSLLLLALRRRPAFKTK